LQFRNPIFAPVVHYDRQFFRHIAVFLRAFVIAKSDTILALKRRKGKGSKEKVKREKAKDG
jgi:hypothetical protein